MRWTIIKQGTNGDFKAPTIVDSNINADWIAIRRAEEILYSGQLEDQIKVLYDSYDRGQVCKLGKYFYCIEKVEINDLPYVTLTLRRLSKWKS